MNKPEDVDRAPVDAILMPRIYGPVEGWWRIARGVAPSIEWLTTGRKWQGSFFKAARFALDQQEKVERWWQREVVKQVSVASVFNVPTTKEKAMGIMGSNSGGLIGGSGEDESDPRSSDGSQVSGDCLSRCCIAKKSPGHECCQSCRYWEPANTQDRFDSECGECRRKAPVANCDKHEDGTETHWPVTHPCEWCGEYELLQDRDWRFRSEVNSR